MKSTLAKPSNFYRMQRQLVGKFFAVADFLGHRGGFFFVLGQL